MNQSPLVSISSDRSEGVSFYKEGASYTFTCSLLGYPLEEKSVEMYFTPCHQGHCRPKVWADGLTPLPKDAVTDPDYHYHWEVRQLGG